MIKYDFHSHTMKELLSLVLFVCLYSFAAAQVKSKVIVKNATLEKVADGYAFTEGPAVAPDGKVYFTDQPNDQILVWDEKEGVSTWMTGTGRSNGMFFDRQGILVSCADEKNELWRIHKDQSVDVLLTDHHGKKHNGPNDLWIDETGGIYFTDPFYKRPWWDHEEQEIAKKNVYYLPSGERQAILVADDFVTPNGIVGSLKKKLLYVSDIEDKKTYRYSILGPGQLSERTLFCEAGSDGMTLDHKGNLYITNTAGVTVFNKKGKQIEQIEIPETWTANVVLGGADRKTLFITAKGSVYTLQMKVRGELGDWVIG